MTRATWLITGGTGSLGREIIPRIAAADPGARLCVLVRAAGRAHIDQRLDELDRYVQTYWGHSVRHRITPLAGDVSFPRLGLDAATYDALAARVTHIVHAAATIRLHEPLDEARRINVAGTREVLRLAERSPRLQRLAHVSTAYVAGDRTGRIREEELLAGQRFLNSYERSKCEAEALLRKRRASVPVTVFRPSIIVGDSMDGHTCNFAAICFPLQLIARGRVNTIPGRPDTPLDLVPVDYVAECVTRLTREPRPGNITYHVVAGIRGSVTTGDLVRAARTLCGSPGLPPLRFTRSSVERGLAETGVSGPAVAAPRSPRPLADHFAYLEFPKEFDDTALERDLDGGIPRPAPAAFLPRVLAFCRDTKWGAQLPWRHMPCHMRLCA
jgi:thioester reductase-like protein